MVRVELQMAPGRTSIREGQWQTDPKLDLHSKCSLYLIIYLFKVTLQGGCCSIQEWLAVSSELLGKQPRAQPSIDQSRI